MTTDGASTDATAALPYNFAPYRAADWARAPLSDPADKEAVVRDRMLYLIEEEAPIHRDALFRRLASSFKSGKLTESVKKSLESALLSLAERVRVDLSGFVFLKDAPAPTVRIPTDAADCRPFEYVSKEELAEAIPVILQSVFGATPNELYHELARVYGIERMSDKVQKRCEEALFLLLMQERVRLLDGKIKLL